MATLIYILIIRVSVASSEQHDNTNSTYYTHKKYPTLLPTCNI